MEEGGWTGVFREDLEEKWVKSDVITLYLSLGTADEGHMYSASWMPLNERDQGLERKGEGGLKSYQ